MPKITMDGLRGIIRREMNSRTLRESQSPEDHEQGADLMKGASRLMGAIKTFEETASEKAKAELDTHLTGLTSVLDRILKSPMNYVDATYPGSAEVKKVTLKPEKKSDKSDLL